MKKIDKNETVNNETVAVHDEIATAQSEKAVNPFENLTAVDSSAATSRRLGYTPLLVDCANKRASEIMLKGSEHAELANKVIADGMVADLLELINTVTPEGQIESDAALLDGCDDDQLARLLESRRSDRSKAKKKGLTTSVTVCKAYISAMYAELMIRAKTGKAYTGSNAAADYDVDQLASDQDALNKKIASLRSKQSRLRKLAQFDPQAKSELESLAEEINRLNALRTGTRRTRTTIKDTSIDDIRKALDSIDPETLPENERATLLELMAKIKEA